MASLLPQKTINAAVVAPVCGRRKTGIPPSWDRDYEAGFRKHFVALLTGKLTPLIKIELHRDLTAPFVPLKGRIVKAHERGVPNLLTGGASGTRDSIWTNIGQRTRAVIGGAFHARSIEKAQQVMPLRARGREHFTRVANIRHGKPCPYSWDSGQYLKPPPLRPMAVAQGQDILSRICLTVSP